MSEPRETLDAAKLTPVLGIDVGATQGDRQRASAVYIAPASAVYAPEDKDGYVLLDPVEQGRWWLSWN